MAEVGFPPAYRKTLVCQFADETLRGRRSGPDRRIEVT
jgi:hypothetical protein